MNEDLASDLPHLRADLERLRTEYWLQIEQMRSACFSEMHRLRMELYKAVANTLCWAFAISIAIFLAVVMYGIILTNVFEMVLTSRLPAAAASPSAAVASDSSRAPTPTPR